MFALLDFLKSDKTANWRYKCSYTVTIFTPNQVEDFCGIAERFVLRGKNLSFQECYTKGISGIHIIHMKTGVSPSL